MSEQSLEYTCKYCGEKEKINLITKFTAKLLANKQCFDCYLVQLDQQEGQPSEEDKEMILSATMAALFHCLHDYKKK